MYSFESADLGSIIYVTDIILQPDNNTVLSYNPLEYPAPFDLYALFKSDIDAAHTNGNAFSSDTLRLAKIYYDGSYDHYSFLVKVTYTPSTDMVRFYFGYINSDTLKPSSTASWSNSHYYEIGYTTLNNNRHLGYLYCNRLRQRNLGENPPAYTGKSTLIIAVGGVQKKTGVWVDPTTPYPYGHMEYTAHAGFQVNRIDIPNCVPVQSNWEANRKLQETIVGTLYDQASFYTEYTDMRFVSDDGGYDPDPSVPDDPPFDPSDPTPYPVTPPSPDSSDVINIPGNPLIGVTTAGFINVYNPAMGDLTGLGDILFPQFSTPTDIINAVEQLYNVIANQNLINYVIDCHVIPVTPQTGSNANIKVGYRDTGISVPVVTNDYIDATCGSLNIPEYFHGYQDYASTRSKLYLPFIGFVDTKPEYWQAGTISVDYKFNVIDGSFMCYIRSVSSKSALNGSVIAQYSGNACSHFPLTGVNYANMVSGIVGAAAGAISGGTASAVLGGAWSAANTVAQGGNIQQSNAYNSTASLMGVREAFLLIERPVPAFPAYYGHDKGYPSNITTALSGVSGFTTIEDIDLSGIPLTQTELEELRGLLKEGVYF